MELIQTQISLYHTLFYVCLTLAVIFAIFAVLFFFLFKINNIVAYLFGFSEKVTTKKMEQANAKTGSLKSGRIDMDFTTSNLSQYEPNGVSINPNAGSEETSRLAPADSQQVQGSVSENALQPTRAPVQPVIPPGFHFSIIENVMVIHSNELI